MEKERYQYVLKDLANGRQMLIRLHVRADGKPAAPSVGVVLPCDPTDKGMTLTLVPVPKAVN